MRENAEILFVASEDMGTALNLLESIEIDVGFDSDDPESIEQAILAVEEAINTRLRGYRGDARVESAILRVKFDFRCAILDQARSDEAGDEVAIIAHTLHSLYRVHMSDCQLGSNGPRHDALTWSPVPA